MAFKNVIVDYLGKLAEMLGTDTIDPADLGSGTRNGTKYLRDDGTWQVPAGGGGGSTLTLQQSSLITTRNIQLQ